MSKKNYTKYSKPDAELIVDDLVEDLNKAIAETPVETVVEEPVVKPEPKKPKTAIGIVKDCARLNVRVNPNIKAEVVTTANVNTTVQIDLSKSTDGWYKVCTETGAEGFCMKDYIEIKS